ncbi:MAG TPA: aminoglycoside adenylyltransferase domain-containing protein [Thermomicrobiales bacterium]|nr:aminoglycoside adenylyltransferase domain-containing protein [Thermomicrobiales bacterium]
MPFHDLVFEEAQTVIRMLLRELDEKSPGVIEDVYIGGSIALREPHRIHSDIDLVLIRPEDIDNARTMAALEPVLAWVREMYPKPEIDAIVLSASDLAAGPDRIEGIRPVIVEGVPELSETGSQRNPVTWATLQQCGITWRGLPLPNADLWYDRAALIDWERRNIDDYWRPWLAMSDHLASRGGILTFRPYFIEWGVLGITRLHATIATGEIFSKYQAGEYGLDHFDERWRHILKEAMRIRSGPNDNGATCPSLYGRNLLKRRSDARAYIATVIEDIAGRR